MVCGRARITKTTAKTTSKKVWNVKTTILSASCLLLSLPIFSDQMQQHFVVSTEPKKKRGIFEIAQEKRLKDAAIKLYQKAGKEVVWELRSSQTKIELGRMPKLNVSHGLIDKEAGRS